MRLSNCKGNEKNDEFMCIKEQWRWGSIVQNGCKTSTLMKDDDDDAIKKKNWN
jgi:hypothetical protein